MIRIKTCKQDFQKYFWLAINIVLTTMMSNMFYRNLKAYTNFCRAFSLSNLKINTIWHKVECNIFLNKNQHSIAISSFMYSNFWTSFSDTQWILQRTFNEIWEYKSESSCISANNKTMNMTISWNYKWRENRCKLSITIIMLSCFSDYDFIHSLITKEGNRHARLRAVNGCK